MWLRSIRSHGPYRKKVNSLPAIKKDSRNPIVSYYLGDETMKKNTLSVMNILFIIVFTIWIIHCVYIRDKSLCVIVFFSLTLNETLYMLIWRHKELTGPSAIKFCIYYAVILIIALAYFIGINLHSLCE